MTDRIPAQVRSRNMQRIKTANTAPEMTVRRYIHAHGLRYSLHRHDLPGRPDMVLPKYHTIIQVQGCFWHQHPGCLQAHIPFDNRKYWLPKLTLNRARDERNVALLIEHGWDVTTVWECQLKDMAMTADRLIEFLEK